MRNSTDFWTNEKLRMLPLAASGTNAFQIAIGEKRCFQLRLPNNQLHRDLLDRGAAAIKLSVWTTAGESSEANVPFERGFLRKEKVALQF
jgi:hypothetical protein